MCIIRCLNLGCMDGWMHGCMDMQIDKTDRLGKDWGNQPEMDWFNGEIAGNLGFCPRHLGFNGFPVRMPNSTNSGNAPAFCRISWGTNTWFSTYQLTRYPTSTKPLKTAIVWYLQHCLRHVGNPICSSHNGNPTIWYIRIPQCWRKKCTIWLWLTGCHGSYHHAIKNGKPSTSMSQFPLV